MAEIEQVSYLLGEDQVRRAAERVAHFLQEEIDRGNDTGAFTILIALALIKDFWHIISNITFIEEFLDFLFIGEIINLFVSAVLWYFMRKQGWWLERKIGTIVNKYELKIIFWGLSGLDMIPLVNTLPLQTFSVLKVWRSVRKRAEEAAQELVDLEYNAQEEIWRIREAATDEMEAETEAEELIEEEASLSSTKPRSELDIMEGSEESSQSEEGGQKQTETIEEIAIPQEVRDPLGKLKKEFFETPKELDRHLDSEDTSSNKAA